MIICTGESVLSSSPKHFKETMASFTNEPCSLPELDVEGGHRPEIVGLVLKSPEPPSLWSKLAALIRKAVVPCGDKSSSPFKELALGRAISILQCMFPILSWIRTYDKGKLRCDVLAGLTLASLSIPQSIGYAGLAKLDPQYGLYTSVVPPLIYAVMGSSREVAVGPVAVVSLLLSSMLQKVIDPSADPVAYRKLAFTATFFAGIFQSMFGLFRWIF